MLDDKKWERQFRNSESGVRKDHGAAALWHDFFVFRCRQRTCSGSSCSTLTARLNEIRSVADAVVQFRQEQPGTQEYGADWDEVIDKLCWLAVDCSRSGEEVWYGGCSSQHAGPNVGLNTLSAATYLGDASLVRKLLDQGQDPTIYNEVFPSSMYIAARTGQTDILLLLQEHLPQLEKKPELTTSEWRSKVGPGSLPGACARGDLEMVRLCLYPPSRAIPEEGETLILGYKPGSIPRFSYLGGYIISSMLVSRSAEVYQYLDSLIASPREGPPDYYPLTNLVVMAQAGHLPMVRYQLDNGANPSNGTYLGIPLVEAVRASNLDTVDLLLKRGANPNEWEYRGRTILTAAARTGSMAMMRKLVDAGIKVRGTNDADSRLHGDLRALQQAVKLEHGAMVELLLDMGAGTESGRASVLRMAGSLGLESMADLLRSRGITRNVPPTAKVDAAKEAGEE